MHPEAKAKVGVCSWRANTSKGFTEIAESLQCAISKRANWICQSSITTLCCVYAVQHLHARRMENKTHRDAAPRFLWSHRFFQPIHGWQTHECFHVFPNKIRSSGSWRWYDQQRRPGIQDHLQDQRILSHIFPWLHLHHHICYPIEYYYPSPPPLEWWHLFVNLDPTWCLESQAWCKNRWHFHTIQNYLVWRPKPKSWLQFLDWSRGKVFWLLVPRLRAQRVYLAL